MASMPHPQRLVTVGVDSHKDVHVAAAVDQLGRLLGTTQAPTTQRGYGQLQRWAQGLGQVDRFGIEGTGSYAVGLARWLVDHGHQVVEVNRPNRQTRRRRGKSDPADAEAAARSALAGDEVTTPKTANGTVEMLRVLRVARRSAMKARTQAANQLDSLIAKLAPKAAPPLLARRGVGPQTAAALLVAAGDNPDRLRSEAAFSMLCGSSPIEASSGKTVRHRLNRGGDRQANNALWVIALARMASDQPTKDYVERRTKLGKSKKDIIRCLKRYIAREVYRDLQAAIAT